jgi:hypothetical protein
VLWMTVFRHSLASLTLHCKVDFVASGNNPSVRFRRTGAAPSPILTALGPRPFPRVRGIVLRKRGACRSLSRILIPVPACHRPKSCPVQPTNERVRASTCRVVEVERSENRRRGRVQQPRSLVHRRP